MNKLCCVQDCNQPALAKGMCGKHYMRMKRTGSPLVVRRVVGASAEERFWQYVDKTEHCWVWTGGKSHGYGNFHMPRDDGGYRQVQAHRFSYELAHGSIPAGLVLDHLCRNKSCVRPQHLQPVRQQINVLRGDVARVIRENTCKHGHEYTPENTYINPKGAKVCRTCQKVNEARYHAKRRVL